MAFSNHSFGQYADSSKYILPVDINTILVANFGELRPNHFHGGIDIKTEHVTGKNLLAIADGYVSRIRKSPAGYGNVIYITHPQDNIVAVYAHMLSFSKKIDSVLLDYQLQVKSNTIDYTDIPPQFLHVEQGEIIGLSGNSGSSTGPHLHFEIRDAISEHALNPLAFFPQLSESSRPRIFGIAITPLTENSSINGAHKTVFLKAIYTGNGSYKTSIPATVYGAVGISITGRDYFTGSPHRFGIYSTELYLDSIKMHQHTMDEIPFHETRFLNSLIDYSHKYNTGIYYEKTYIDPNNRLSIYNNSVNNGIIISKDSSRHRATIITSDFHGNTSEITIPLIFEKCDTFSIDTTINALYWEDFQTKTDEYYLFIPKGTLYCNAAVKVVPLPYKPSRAESKAYSFHNANTPVHKTVTIGIKADSTLLANKDGLILCRLSKGKRTIYAGGYWIGDFLCAESKYFGDFFIARDNTPPSIRPLYFRNNANLRGRTSMRFRVADNLSGIAQYNAFIDGKWTPITYDKKYGTMDIEFIDRVQPIDGNKHTIRIVLLDNAGNRKESQLTYYR